MQNHQNLVQDPHDTTFEWFVHAAKSLQEEAQRAAREKFTGWLESGHGVFHISGKPGSGKSTLMKYLIEHTATSGHLNVWASELSSLGLKSSLEKMTLELTSY